MPADSGKYGVIRPIKIPETIREISFIRLREYFCQPLLTTFAVNSRRRRNKHVSNGKKLLMMKEYIIDWKGLAKLRVHVRSPEARHYFVPLVKPLLIAAAYFLSQNRSKIRTDS